MHLTKSLTFLALGSGASSFVVDIFEGADCSGRSQEVNVWDNTCRDTHIFPYRSVRVKAYGAGRQRATLWWENYCSYSGGRRSSNWWADGGSDKFKKGACLNTDGYVGRALGSHSA